MDFTAARDYDGGDSIATLPDALAGARKAAGDGRGRVAV
jgi:hypothetical protein